MNLRYRQLVNDCEQEEITFGIVPFIGNTLKDMGTFMKLMSVDKRYPDGKLDIKTTATGIFRMETFYRHYPEKLYSGAEVEPINFSSDSDPVVENKLIELAVELFSILQIEKPLSLDNKPLSFVIAHHLGLLLEQGI